MDRKRSYGQGQSETPQDRKERRGKTTAKNLAFAAVFAALLIGCIVLLITLVGLVGYLDDEMRRRSREIAIRKVNGASAADIFALLTRDAAVLTLPSVAAGTLAGYLVLARVLELFVERIALRWWIFAGVAAAVTALVLVILLIRTWRAITENPRIKTE